MKKVIFLLMTALAAGLHGQTPDTLPYSESFDSGAGAWTIVDYNNDGYTWDTLPTGAAAITPHGGSGFIGSSSYAGGHGLNPDDFLISPPIVIGYPATLKWWHRSTHHLYSAEHYSVYVASKTDSAGGFLLTNPVFSTTLIESDALGWAQNSVDLSAFVGDTVRIAFRHHGCYDQFALLIDDVEVDMDSSFAAAATVPYFTGFESTDDTGWTFINSHNGWYVDSVASMSGRGLYISGDSGAHNTVDHLYTGFSWAVRSIAFADSGDYRVEYDWRCSGYRHPYTADIMRYYDYMRLFLVPAGTTFSPTDFCGYSTPHSVANYTPGWICLSHNDSLECLLGSSTWQHHAEEFQVPHGGVWQLVVVWANSSTVPLNEEETFPSAALDNLSIGSVSCLAINDLTLWATGINQRKVTWTAGGNEDHWAVYLDGALAEVVDTTEWAVPDTACAAGHEVGVRSLCGGGDTAAAVTLTLGNTALECGLYRLPYREGFEGYAPYQSPVPCWTIRHSSIIDTNRVPYIVADTANPQGYRSPSALWFYSLYRCEMFTPFFNAPADSLHIRFRARAGRIPDSGALLQVALCTQGDVADDMSTGEILLTIDANALDSNWTLYSLNTLQTTIAEPVCIGFIASGNRFGFYIDEVEVTFYRDTVPDTVWREVSVSSADPTMGTVNGGHTSMHYTLPDSSTLAIEATALEGFRFTTWNDGDSSAQRTILVASDTVLVAYFEADSGSGTGIDAPGCYMANVLSRRGCIVVESGLGATVRVVSLSGQTIYCGRVPAGPIPVPAGVYVVQVGESYIKKVIVP